MRGSNIKKDLRLLGYEFYPNFSFAVVNGCKGDCLDRYLVRMNECIESTKLIYQCISVLLRDCLKFAVSLYEVWIVFAEQEAPKGEMLLCVVGERLSIRCPDYFCLQVLNVISHNHLLADLITLLGTLDFVLGSVDRFLYQYFSH